MSRDDQFAGWASAVLSQMFDATKEHIHGDSLDIGSEEAQQAMHQAVARAGYDLVEHAIGSINPIAYQACSDEEIMASIPDMAELLEEKTE